MDNTDIFTGMRDIRLRTPARATVGLDRFTAEYGDNERYCRMIQWDRVAERYQGIVITPYIWSRRLEPETHWYYPWDCASGCIWDGEAVESITVLAPMACEVTA